jgi:hypothetical protein
LLEFLGPKVDVLYAGRERGLYSAHLETLRPMRTADSCIRAFCGLIEKLPNTERALWNAAAVRSFSIGIQAGTQPSVRDFRVRPETIRRVSGIGAGIVLTIYSPTIKTITVDASGPAARSHARINLFRA